MFKAHILFLIIFVLPTIMLCSPQDDNAKAFFRGIISQGLRNENWNDPILDQINANNFDVQALLKGNEVLDKYNAVSIRYKAAAEILKSFVNVLNALFPITSFSLRNGEIERAVPEKYTGVFNVLNRNVEVYAEENTVTKIVESNDFKLDLNPISPADYYKAGASFESLTEKINAINIELRFLGN